MRQISQIALLSLAVAGLVLACGSDRRGRVGGGGGGGGGGAQGGGQGADGSGEADGGAGGAGVAGGGAGGEAQGEGEGEGESPLDESGCTPGDSRCHGDELYYCLNDKSWALAEDCAEQDKVCEDGACQGCEPEERRCQGQSVMVCEEDGLTETVEVVCPDGTQCEEGQCQSACGGGDNKFSNAGCEYWAVDLDNINTLDDRGAEAIVPADGQFAVVVANVERVDANITVYRSNGPGDEEVVDERLVRSGDVGLLELPARSQVGPGKGFKAYRIVADQPIIAYQFNPLNNTDEAFSNDASLLIPGNTLGQEYWAVSGDGIPGGEMADNWSAYVTVVGTTEDPVEVTVEASDDIESVQGEDVRVQGRVVTATLHRYEVLSVHSAPDDQWQDLDVSNLSGTRVAATGPVAVFSGNVATAMPTGPDAACCADHLEEMLWPSSTWGRVFVAPRSLTRRPGSPEPDYWRITGGTDGTRLEYFPRTPAGAPSSIEAGESVQFSATEHFAVVASEPLLLTQFLSSSGQLEPDSFAWPPCSAEGPAGDAECARSAPWTARCNDYGLGGVFCAPVGDPAMILVPPAGQFRRTYVFLTPADYWTDFANIVAPSGATVRLDGEVVRGWQEVARAGDATWQVATVEVSDGRHTLEADADVGLLLYGYDRDVSYGFPGGLNLGSLNDTRD